jgi:tetratricopeptide (TPR) repeat protein
MSDVIALVRRARPHLSRTGSETESWLSRLEERHAEIHELVEELLATDPVAAAKVCSTLWTYWWLRGHMQEGREFLERASALDGVDKAPVLKGLGTIAFRQGDLDGAGQAFVERFELVEAEGSRADYADACADLARVALRRGDFAEVRRHAERGYEAAEELDDPAALRLPLHMRAAAARMEGSYAEARELYLRSIDLNNELGNELNVAGENHNLFYVALHTGDLAEARRRFNAAADWAFASDNAYLRPYMFLDAGVLALREGDVERAARLVSCAARIFRETDSIPDPDDHVELDKAIFQLREKLGERFETVWAEGQQLSADDARGLVRI